MIQDLKNEKSDECVSYAVIGLRVFLNSLVPCLWERFETGPLAWGSGQCSKLARRTTASLLSSVRGLERL